MISRVIKATLEKGLIKEFDPESNSRKIKNIFLIGRRRKVKR